MVSVIAGNSVARTVIAPVATLPAFTVTARGAMMIDPRVTAVSDPTVIARDGMMIDRRVTAGNGPYTAPPAARR